MSKKSRKLLPWLFVKESTRRPGRHHVRCCRCGSVEGPFLGVAGTKDFVCASHVKAGTR